MLIVDIVTFLKPRLHKEKDGLRASEMLRANILYHYYKRSHKCPAEKNFSGSTPNTECKTPLW